MIKKILTVGIASIVLSTAQAGEFKGEGGLGLTMTGGNSDTQNINGSLAAKYVTGKFTNNFSLTTNQSESTDAAGVTTETADSLKYGYKLDYALDDKSYLWGSYTNDSNEFAGYDTQTAMTAGYGRTFIKNDKTLFTGEIGLGTKDTEFNGSSSDESITHLALNYENKLSETTQFIQKVLFQIGDDNDYTESFSAIKVAMDKKLALQFSYLLKKNSDIVGANGDDTDTTTAVTVVYGF